MSAYTWYIVAFAAGFFVSFVLGKTIKIIFSVILVAALGLVIYLRFFT